MSNIPGVSTAPQKASTPPTPAKKNVPVPNAQPMPSQSQPVKSEPSIVKEIAFTEKKEEEVMVDPFATKKDEEVMVDPFAAKKEEEVMVDPFAAVKKEEEVMVDPFAAAKKEDEEVMVDPFAAKKEEEELMTDPFAAKKEEEEKELMANPFSNPSNSNLKQDVDSLFSNSASFSLERRASETLVGIAKAPSLAQQAQSLKAKKKALNPFAAMNTPSHVSPSTPRDDLFADMTTQQGMDMFSGMQVSSTPPTQSPQANDQEGEGEGEDQQQEEEVETKQESLADLIDRQAMEKEALEQQREKEQEESTTATTTTMMSNAIPHSKMKPDELLPDSTEEDVRQAAVHLGVEMKELERPMPELREMKATIVDVVRYFDMDEEFDEEEEDGQRLRVIFDNMLPVVDENPVIPELEEMAEQVTCKAQALLTMLDGMKVKWGKSQKKNKLIRQVHAILNERCFSEIGYDIKVCEK